MSAFNRPMSILSKTILLAPSALTIHLFFKPCHSKFMIFQAKIGILGKYSYASYTLFRLYLEGKLYLEKKCTLFGILAVATLITSKFQRPSSK